MQAQESKEQNTVGSHLLPFMLLKSLEERETFDGFDLPTKRKGPNGNWCKMLCLLEFQGSCTDFQHLKI